MTFRNPQTPIGPKNGAGGRKFKMTPATPDLSQKFRGPTGVLQLKSGVSSPINMGVRAKNHPNNGFLPHKYPLGLDPRADTPPMGTPRDDLHDHLFSAHSLKGSRN